MGLRAAEAANMRRVQSLSAADGIMSVTAHNALCLVLAQTCARTRSRLHPPRATVAVLLENTHLHPSYKVAVVTRAFQALIDESGPNKRLRRSNPPCKIYGSDGGGAFSAKICDDHIARRWPGERLMAV